MESARPVPGLQHRMLLLAEPGIGFRIWCPCNPPAAFGPDPGLRWLHVLTVEDLHPEGIPVTNREGTRLADLLPRRS